MRNETCTSTTVRTSTAQDVGWRHGDRLLGEAAGRAQDSVATVALCRG